MNDDTTLDDWQELNRIYDDWSHWSHRIGDLHDWLTLLLDESDDLDGIPTLWLAAGIRQAAHQYAIAKFQRARVDQQLDAWDRQHRVTHHAGCRRSF